MNVKIRDMKNTGLLEGKCDKKYFSKIVEFRGKEAVASITKWINVTEKFEVHYNFKDEVIVDNNYTWIQIAPIGDHYWIKAMYDENDNLVEVYIDVTVRNNFDDIENPKYEDLFLDIIIPRKGHIYQMDDVELIKAYHENVITKEEFDMAKWISAELRTYLENNLQSFLDYLVNLREELRTEII